MVLRTVQTELQGKRQGESRLRQVAGMQDGRWCAVAEREGKAAALEEWKGKAGWAAH